MAEVVETQNVDTGAQATGNTDEGQNNQNIDFTPITSKEELDKLIQSEADKRVTQGIKTAQTKWEQEYAQKIEDAKEEASKLAKMNADEKARYALEKREKEMAEKEKEYARKELKLTTIDILNERKLPIDFVDFIMTTDAETTKANIDSFEKLWQAKLEEAVNGKLKGSTPKSGSGTTLTKESIKNMSAAEINANWDAVQKVMNQK